MSDIGGKSRSAVTSAASGQSGLGPQPDTFREVRRNLDASVLPLATSVDGRRFSFQASLYGLELQVGSYVVLEGGGTRYLGQVLTLGLDRQPVTELTLPAQSAGVPEARTEVQIRYASGFDRHTFLCGQSGSGKTYSLGVILERLLIETDLRMVVLDPNSDFVRLAALTGSDHPVARRLGQSVTFRQGEGLIAGKISPQPALLRFGARISQEGGADVPATWAAAR
jgi:uncharacterized protein